MTAVVSPLESRRAPRRTRSIATLLAVTTLLEFALGTALLVAPKWAAHGLTGAPHTSDEMAAVLRLAGGAVLAIGLCCGLGLLSESGSSRGRPLDLVPGLVVYYGCAVAILADAIMRRVQAPLLWPAMLVHAALLVWCVVCLASERTVRR